MLVPMIDILNRAQKEGYAVLAPNCHDEPSARAAIQAAAELESPVILGILPHVTPSLVTLGKCIAAISEEFSIPIALNLDHGDSFEKCVEAFRGGFTSIMVDRSMLPYEENIAQVAEFVKFCKVVNVTVEAEFGQIAEGEEYEINREAYMTDPALVKDFVDRSGIDCLAVSIGMAHGEYTTEPVIDFERLKKIRANVECPLVFHGGSGSGDENIRQACKIGMQKVNMGTAAYVKAVEDFYAQDMKENISNGHRMAYNVMNKGYKEVCKHYMTLTGQIGKAW